MTALAGSVCSGYGGLDIAVAEVLGVEFAWHAENDPAPAAVLAHHYPEVPNLGDIKAVDWSAVEPVAVLTALLLEDGSIVYGCVHCDYTSERPGGVRPHLGKHAVRPSGRPPNRRPVPKDLTVADLLSAAAQIDKLTADRDAWKTRAVKAEREMAALRRLLNGAQ